MLAAVRNSFLRFGYVRLLKPVFFANDPEKVHDGMAVVGKALGAFAPARALVRAAFGYSHLVLSQQVLGIRFENPVGLSAGFDKNAELTGIVPSVGFGWMEVGSITGERCEGNPKPRLWRLPQSKGLVVWYGLKNDGSEAISKRLSGKRFAIPVGTSVAMTNSSENLDREKAIADYAKAFAAFADIGAYTTVNISCPNTQGGQPFSEPDALDALLARLDTIPTAKPVFVKLSPDTDRERADLVLEVLKRHHVHGIVISNLTKKRDDRKIQDAHVPEKGGISGKVVQDLSDDLLSYIYKKEGKRFVLVGCGGIFTTEDAYKKIRKGATLLQMITGMVFEGPQVVSEINRGLALLLRRDGFKNVSEAVGADYKLES